MTEPPSLSLSLVGVFLISIYCMSAWLVGCLFPVHALMIFLSSRGIFDGSYQSIFSIFF